MSAVEQLEGGVICPHARPVGQYGQLAAVAHHKALRGVIGHLPASADKATLYLSLVRWLSPFPIPLYAWVWDHRGTKGQRLELRIPRNIVVTPGRAFRMSGLVPQTLICPHLSVIEPGMG